MRYADEQLTRSQHENGCDYGHGRRSVLVRNGKKQLLHIAGASHWSGIGMRNYGQAEIVVYPDDKHTGKQRTLAEGRMNKQRWADIAEEIYKHLDVVFPLDLISLKHTLLLDEPGEVTGPPEPAPGDKKPSKPHPKIESDRFYRIIMEEDNTCKLLEFSIVKQVRGQITYKLQNGREIERKAKHLIEDGAGATVKDAVAGYLRHYQEQVADATERLRRAAHSFTYHDDQLMDAKTRIERLLPKEEE